MTYYVVRTQNELFLTIFKVRKNYNYKIVAAKDLEGHAELKTSVVKQRMSINFTAPADLLKFYLEQLSFDVVEFGDPLRKWIEPLYFSVTLTIRAWLLGPNHKVPNR